ncbi:immunity 52 family protein [Myxococcus qinghaiensis]|uniref:immunity 52 family protein n=1 Tax=Myxococcus qinghaiensis TaxID=2906758 RepID=UPI0020A81023|nr:immunity 52 family protein [Myxococcus qinghaiensis]MCP3167867.1 immunity 52 family protein [Myxococcus qinghaiensis]
MVTTPEDAPNAETYYAGAYWGPRKESPEDCALRTANFLSLLAECDPLLAHWYKPTKSRKDAQKYPLMPPDVPTLAEQFRRGVNRERGGPVIEQLGFSFWFGNGGAGADGADLRLTCGSYSEAVPNSCVMTLPKHGANAERIIAAPVLPRVVSCMASAWDADWALATSWDHREKLSDEARTGTFVGWVTYLSLRRGTVPPLPAPVRIQQVEGKGTLVVLTPERFTVTNPEHLALAKRVRELLSRAGLLPPVLDGPA